MDAHQACAHELAVGKHARMNATFDAALQRSLDPTLLSWVESANHPATDFPLQNLPFGRFRHIADIDAEIARADSGAENMMDGDVDQGWRIGVAIGDQVLDLKRANLIDTGNMNRLMHAGRQLREALRIVVSQGLSVGSAREKEWRTSAALVPQNTVEMSVPCTIGDFTDFYSSLHHANRVAQLFRPGQPLLPNYKWVPLGYHGRASSIRVSGHHFQRPRGQICINDVKGGAALPALGLSRQLDFELELGAFIASPNALGQPLSMLDAEDHCFGLVLLNDWSARDIQAWEAQPLGPFLSKNFATTISPWIVTLDALQPFRVPFLRLPGDPAPLSYLDAPKNRLSGAFDIQLEVWLQTQTMRSANSAPQRLMTSNYRDAYWTLAQLMTHHTVNGCNLRSGDLLGSGTLSGPRPEQGASLLELSCAGQHELLLVNGETRTFLEDGDTVILRACCERPGLRRIGFGACAGTVQAGELH